MQDSPAKAQPFSFEKIFNKIIIYLPAGVAIHLLVSLYAVDFKMFSNSHSLNPWYLALAFLMGLLPWYFHSVRIRNLTIFINQPTRLWNCFKIAIGVDLGAAITPTAFGGSPLKIGLFMEEGIKPAKAISLTLFSSIEDFTFFTIAVIGALFFVQADFLVGSVNLLKTHIQISHILSAFGFLTALSFIGYFLIQKFGRALLKYYWVRKIYRLYTETVVDIINLIRLILRRGKWIFLLNVTLAAVQWLAKYAVIYFLLSGIGIFVDPVEVFLMQIVIYVLMNLIPTPGAVVGAEAIFFLVFSQFLPAVVVLPVTSAWRLLTFYLQLTIGAGLFMFLNNKKLNVEPEQS